MYALRSSKLMDTLEEQYNITLGDRDSFDDPVDGLMDLIDDGNDLGVGAWKDMNMDELGDLLSIDASTHVVFPFFNVALHDYGTDPSKIDGFAKIKLPALPKRELGDEDVARHQEELEELDEDLGSKHMRRLWPRWHQLVGLVAILARFFDGKNVLLADGVGVGKTMQAFMTIAYLRFLRRKSSESGRPVIPPFGECPLRARRSPTD